MLTSALRRLLALVLLLFGLLGLNSVYLLSVTIAGQVSGRVLENYTYLLMFLGHLGLGLLLIVPVLVFGALHMRRAWRRRNRYAVRAGMALYITTIVLLLSGLLLTRFGFLEVNDPGVRSGVYWLHVLSPLLLGWLFVLHRLAGPQLRWRRGIGWGLAMLLVIAVALLTHLRPADAPELTQPFLPSLLQVRADGANRMGGVGATGADGFIPAAHLSTDAACGECHMDILSQTEHSMHRFSSFNNPAYRFSVEEAREVLAKRDGNVDVARLCASCHDPVPLLSGDFGRADYDPDQDPHSQDGITCLSCHAVTAINGPRGNGDYTVTDPPRYPFAFSDNPLLKAINHQLIKAKPEFHKATLLKPLHQSAEFCAGCHKVALPFALNHYRWLRGQDHYDSFLLSGVSGHRVDSFYYPPQALKNCAACHMAAIPSDDPAARDLNGNGQRALHNHLFPAANTGVASLLGEDQDHEQANRQRRDMLTKAARVDIFALKQDGAVDGKLSAPLRPDLPLLQPGKRYLIETVVRTLGVGHALTQGTSDSNELWLDLSVSAGGRVIARSGALDGQGEVDPWAYFLNAYLLDKDGNRIERRNAQDIFVTLYNHQIPPGAAAVAHYALTLPEDIDGPLTIKAALRYRKFDSRFVAHVQGDTYNGNKLPITTMTSDSITLPVAGYAPVAAQTSIIPAWQRWNDYGIALLREGNQGANKGNLRAAADAFAQVEAQGHADGALNLARVYYKEGRIDDTAAALRRAAAFDPPAPVWTVDWYSALVEREQGNLDAAIARLDALVAGYPSARARGFDFSRDYQMLNELGRTLFERARQERGEPRKPQRDALLQRSLQTFRKVLQADPENVSAHYNLALVYSEMGDPQQAAAERELHQRYRPDDHAVERAATLHRQRNPAANHAAESVAVYALQPTPPTATAIAVKQTEHDTDHEIID